MQPSARSILRQDLNKITIRILNNQSKLESIALKPSNQDLSLLLGQFAHTKRIGDGTLW